jgi:hypothetical protein
VGTDHHRVVAKIRMMIATIKKNETSITKRYNVQKLERIRRANSEKIYKDQRDRLFLMFLEGNSPGVTSRQSITTLQQRQKKSSQKTCESRPLTDKADNGREEADATVDGVFSGGGRSRIRAETLITIDNYADDENHMHSTKL